MPAALICVHFKMLYFSLILWDSVYSLVGFSLFGNTKERMLTVVLFATVRCILNSYWTASSSPPSSSKSNNLTKKRCKNISTIYSTLKFLTTHYLFPDYMHLNTKREFLKYERIVKLNRLFVFLKAFFTIYQFCLSKNVQYLIILLTNKIFKLFGNIQP